MYTLFSTSKIDNEYFIKILAPQKLMAKIPYITVGLRFH